MGTGFVWHEKYMWHHNGPATGLQHTRGAYQPGVHLENAETKRKLKNLLDAYGVTEQLSPIAPALASVETLQRFTRIRRTGAGVKRCTGRRCR